MGMIEMVLPKIAKSLGRSPQEIQQAYQQAKKMLPPKVNNLSEGKEILKNIGVNGNFIDEMANKYAPLASLFGFNKNKVNEYASQLKDNNTNNTENKTTKQSNSVFDKNKYKKI